MNSMKQQQRPTKGRSSVGGSASAHNNSTAASKPPTRAKPSHVNERTVSPEGIYYNGRVMHVTTSLVGCVVQVEMRDGNKFEGVLRTFSPEFELVIETVAKVEPKNTIVTASNNIGNLLASLKAENTLKPTVIFNIAEIVKISAINVDLNYATIGCNQQQSHFLTDTEISQTDPRSDGERELVPWDGGDADGVDIVLDGHSENGWDADDMFKYNKDYYKVDSSYDPNLKGYTTELKEGEGKEYQDKLAKAAQIADEIEKGGIRDSAEVGQDSMDKNDEDLFSAVHRPTRDYRSNREPPRSQGRSGNKYPEIRSSLSNRKPNQPYRPPYKPSSSSPPSSHTNKPFPSQSPPSKEEVSPKPPYAGVAAGNCKPSDSEEPLSPKSGSPANPAPLPQRHPDGRRSIINNKRTPETTQDLKKMPSTNNESSSNNIVKEASAKPDASHSNQVLSGATSSGKPKDSVSSAVKDKTEPNIQTPEKESEKQESAKQTPVESEADKPKKSTLNPNAKIFTPRSPQTPISTVNTASTPPSISSTPNTIMNHHQPPLTHHHHPPQRLQNPLIQMQPNTPTYLPIQVAQSPSQYFMNVVPPFTQQSVTNTSLRFRNKGPQQYANHPNRGDYTQPAAHVAAATGHPVLASGPMAAPQQPIAYTTQQPSIVSTPSGPPQAMYPNMFSGYPRMNVMPPHVSMMQHAIQYDPTQLQHLYSESFLTMSGPPDFMSAPQTGQVQLHPHIVSQAQAHQHVVTSSGQHSTSSTPQSATPTTPMHGPAPSPVHHQPNQPPTPTPPQVMYGGVPSPHNPQTPVGVGGGVGVGGAPNSAPYQHQILLLQSPGQQVQVPTGHHSSGGMHHMSHSAPGNHHGAPPTIMSALPVQLISSNAASGAISFAPNPGV